MRAFFCLFAPCAFYHRAALLSIYGRAIPLARKYHATRELFARKRSLTT